jgi:hypothetical protein
MELGLALLVRLIPKKILTLTLILVDLDVFVARRIETQRHWKNGIASQQSRPRLLRLGVLASVGTGSGGAVAKNDRPW